MEVFVDANDAEVLLSLKNGGKRMAYAISNAIRSSLLGAQKAVHNGVRDRFTVRSNFVIQQSAVIKGRSGGSGFPSPTRLEGRFTTGDKPRLLLGKFEDGQLRTPFTPGAKHVAVPMIGNAARPTKKSKVPSRFYFSNLRLSSSTPSDKPTTANAKLKRPKKSLALVRHVTKRGKTQWKGTSRTFLLTHTKRAPQGGVFQRVGPAKSDIRLIWSFQTPFKLPQILKYDETARRYVEAVFNQFLIEEVNKTLAFNKSK